MILLPKLKNVSLKESGDGYMSRGIWYILEHSLQYNASHQNNIFIFQKFVHSEVKMHEHDMY
jgi:hypothetical protein